jgi:hypothetical protein
MFSPRLIPLFVIAAIAIVAALLSPPIPQDPSYHSFADQRAFFGIPNFWNVISNGPYILVGLYGLWAWNKSRWHEPNDRWPWLVIALATILIGVGSGYYHWTPNTQTLFWDRLPMTLVFMALFSVAIMERIHSRWGFMLFGPFLVLGVLSVEVWRRGELTGVGDLRFYALVQFYPSIALPLILWLFRSRYTHGGMLWRLAICYLVAKFLEAADDTVFAWTGSTISGHTLKHFLSAIGMFEAMRMLRIRSWV